MISPRGAGGFGGKLREARERRGVTLRQIANATKISIGALEALERNDLSRLPGGIFSRAFVRSYALEVGLDPEQTIQEFIAQFPNNSVAAGRLRPDQIEDNVALESDRRIASTVLRLLLVSVPLGGLLLYFMTTPPGSDTPVQPAPARTAGAAQTAGAASPAPEGAPSRSGDAKPADASGAASPAAPAIASDRLVVGLTATGPCWISATADGRQVFERELKAGDQQTVEAVKTLVLVVGDAGALRMVINGQAAKPVGRSGQVVTVRLRPDDFKSYLIAP
jgi:cytoskeletal protein RodZ